MAAQRHPGAGRQKAEGQRQHTRQSDHDHDQNRPQQCQRKRQHPTHKQGQHSHRCQQRPTQVVDHLPAPDWRDSAKFGRIARKNPWQKLPVAARPAMVPPDIDVVPCGKILDNLDVRGKGGACEHALEQIVAQHGVFRHAPGQRRLECINVVNALAGKGTFAEQILIQVGSGRRIGLDPAGTGEQLLIDRPVLPVGQGGADARLQDAVSAENAVRCGVDACAVQRMGDLAHHLCDRPAQQPGVGIQRDDIAHSFRQCAADDGKTRVRGSTQQTVKFAQLATLAFPPHPDALGWVPQPAAVQKIKAIPVV